MWFRFPAANAAAAEEEVLGGREEGGGSVPVTYAAAAAASTWKRRTQLLTLLRALVLLSCRADMAMSSAVRQARLYSRADKYCEREEDTENVQSASCMK